MIISIFRVFSQPHLRANHKPLHVKFRVKCNQMSKVVPPQFYPFRPLPLNHAPSHSLSVALHIHFGPETTILAFSEAQSSGYVERCDRNIMRALLAASMLGASLRSGRAAVVEAGTLTTVTVQAPLYDTTTSPADGGCSPEGCVGDNTRVSRQL